jgi:hypothetical protein
MGFDNQRTGLNPKESTITTTNATGLHKLWGPTLLTGGEVGEPVYASNVKIGAQTVNVLYAGSSSGLLESINADTGAVIKTRQLGASQYMCGTFALTFGANDAPGLDRAHNRLYIQDGLDVVHAVDLATLAEAPPPWNPPTIATTPSHNFPYGGLTYNPNLNPPILYAETSSTCDISPWFGRIAAINATTGAIIRTFYPTRNPVTGALTSGGGIWGFGGASIDPNTNNVFIATGNADSKVQPQTAFLAEQVVELSPDLSTVIAHSYASLPPNPDADYGATPLLFQPSGCHPLVAAVNKAGVFALWDRTAISSGPIETIQMSASLDAGDFIGVPSWDGHYVYVGLPTTNTDPLTGITYKPGAGAFSINPATCLLNKMPVWNAHFGSDGTKTQNDTPRSPITIANGVLYVNDYDSAQAFALRASDGVMLWTQPLSAHSPVGPIVIHGHLYTSDLHGQINAWTP